MTARGESTDAGDAAVTAQTIRWVATRIAEIMGRIRTVSSDRVPVDDPAAALASLSETVGRLNLPNQSTVLGALEGAATALREGDRREAIQRLSSALMNVTREQRS